MQFDVNGFIDIHTHILPGIDDGSTSFDQSIKLAKCCEDSGIKRIIATPHFLPGTAWAAPKEKVVELVETLQQKIDEARVGVQIYTGMEIAFHGNLMQRIQNESVLPLGLSQYYLIEPSFSGPQDSLLETLDHLIDEGIKIILAHPERIETLWGEFDILRKLVRKGLLIQVNYGSLLGFFGSKARRATFELWSMKCLHFIASDFHNLDDRKCIETVEWNLLKADKRVLDMLNCCNDNILKIF